jgi:hypothetical protein
MLVVPVPSNLAGVPIETPEATVTIEATVVLALLKIKAVGVEVEFELFKTVNVDNAEPVIEVG